MWAKGSTILLLGMASAPPSFRFYTSCLCEVFNIGNCVSCIYRYGIVKIKMTRFWESDLLQRRTPFLLLYENKLVRKGVIRSAYPPFLNLSHRGEFTIYNADRKRTTFDIYIKPHQQTLP